MSIAGYAGIGKITFCKELPGEALDLICMAMSLLDADDIPYSRKRSW